MSRTKPPKILFWCIFLVLCGLGFGCTSTHKIIVLPYDNYSAKPTDHWLRDGFSESMNDHLQYVKKLEVLPREDINEICKNLDLSPYVHFDEEKAAKIGRKLRARYVIIGRFRRSNDSLIVFSRIVNSYKKRIEHQFRLRTEAPKNYRFFSQVLGISEYTAYALGGSGEIRQIMEPASRRTKSFKAFEYYINGRLASFQGRTEDYRVAINWYRQAINADYSYALAYGAIADVYTEWGFLLKQRNRAYHEEYRKAHQNLKDALKYDPKLPAFHIGRARRYLEADIHYVVGDTHLRNQNYEAAIAAFRKNLDLTPNDSLTLFGMGEAYLGMGDVQRSRHYYTSALEYNPALVKAIDRLEELTSVPEKKIDYDK